MSDYCKYADYFVNATNNIGFLLKYEIFCNNATYPVKINSSQ